MAELGSLVATGRTSDVYEYGSADVVKVPRPTVPQHWAAMEARFTTAVRALGAPAPAVRGLVRLDGRDAIVFERVRGPSLWDRMRESPRDLPAMARELADIHRSILSTGLPHEVASLVERVHGKLAEADQLSGAERDEANAELRRLPSGAALLHGDLHPGNVLLSPRGPIVIDWFDAAIGHPMADIVRSSLLLRPIEPVAERPHLPGSDPHLLRVVHDEYLAHVRAELTASVDETRILEAIMAASRLAEGVAEDEEMLLTLWRGRGEGTQSYLLDAAMRLGIRINEHHERFEHSGRSGNGE